MGRTNRKKSAKEAVSPPPAPPVVQPPAPPAGTTCIWTFDEELEFADYLTTRTAQQGESGTFRQPILQDAAKHIAHLRVKGAVKTAKTCGDKYRHLKKKFEGVRAIKNYSGLEWSEQYGANIGPATEHVWQELLAVQPNISPFKNIGWSEKLYEKMQELVPVKAKGSNIFNGATSRPREASTQMSDTEGPDAADQETPGDSESSTPPGSPLGSLSRIPSQSLPQSPPTGTQNTPPPIPVTPPRTSSGKRVHRMLESVSETKRPRLTPTAKSIIGMGEEFKGLTTLMQNVFQPELMAGLDATPKRKVRASDHAQNCETWLSPKDLVRFLRVLETDVNAADAYLAIKSEDLRIMWVKDRLGMHDM